MDSDEQTEIEDLPDGCLSRVFEHLERKDRDSAALACRRWLGIDRRLRTVLLFVAVEDPGFASCLSRLLQQCAQVTRISFLRCTKLLDASLQPLASLSSLTAGRAHLVSLTLNCCTALTGAALAWVAEGCGSALEVLNLVRCTSITDAGLAPLAIRFTCLQVLDLSYSWLSDRGIEFMLDACPCLTKITVSHSLHIRGWGFRLGRSLRTVEAEACRFNELDLQKGLRGMPGLLDLYMGWNMCAGLRQPSAALRSIGDSCKMLEVLCLQQCRVLDDSAVENIVRNCPKLRELNLAICPEVTVRGWQAVAQFSVKLELFFVFRSALFCDQSLLAVQSHCPCLRIICFYGCPRLSSSAIELFCSVRGHVYVMAHEFTID